MGTVPNINMTLKFIISVSELKKDLCTNDFAEIPNYSTCSNLFFKKLPQPTKTPFGLFLPHMITHIPTQLSLSIKGGVKYG